MRSLILSLVLLLAATAPVQAAPRPECLFVNANSSPNAVASFQISRNGHLTPAVGSPFSTFWPSSLRRTVGSLTASGDYLYATSSGDQLSVPGTVAGFRIQEDCSLVALPGSPWQAGFGAAGVAATAELVFVANHTESTLKVYRIAEDGTLAPERTIFMGPNQGPFDMELDPRGRTLFLNLHTFAKIAVFRIGRGGDLRPVVGSPFDLPGMFLHGLTLSKNGRRLYDVSSRFSVTGMEIARDGSLEPLDGSPYPVPSPGDDLLLHRGGRLLFNTTSSGDVHVLRARPDGSLRPAPGSPFDTPGHISSGLAQDAQGRFLFVTHFGAAAPGLPSFVNSVSVHRIDPRGSLTLVGGLNPLSVFGFSSGVLHWSRARDRP